MWMSTSCVGNPRRGILRAVRPSVIVFAALVVLAGAAAISGSSAVERSAAAPRITLLDTQPVTVRGTGFESAERVQVAAFTGV